MLSHKKNILSPTWSCNIEYVKLNIMNKIFDFLGSVRVELEKVTWPKPELTARLTVVVILVTIAVGFFLGGIDFLLTKLLELVLSK